MSDDDYLFRWGHMPGHCFCTCRGADCGKTFFGAKRSLVCKECAEKRRQEEEASVIDQIMARGISREDAEKIQAAALESMKKAPLGVNVDTGEPITWPEGYQREHEAFLRAKERAISAEKEIEDLRAGFNKAIEFAFEMNAEGLTFLRLWHQGDWPAIERDFPEYPLDEFERGGSHS